MFLGILPGRKYRHFLYLHIAIRILASKDLYRSHNEYADNCLKYFVAEFAKLYGKHHLVFNVHSLVHLASDCLIHGPLDYFSAFAFETFLWRIKKMIRSGNRVLAQIVKRISELNHLENRRRCNNIQLPDDVLQIKCDTRNDSFYMADDETVIKVLSITEGKHLISC